MEPSPIFDLDAYFARIGYTGPREPTLATLHAIVRHHTATIPFENLDVLLGHRIQLDPASLQKKLIHDRRGGYCFEQNGLLLLVLEALGYRVTPLSARVRWQRPRDFTPPRTHLFLRVELNGESWIADVGVGGVSPTCALGFIESVVQTTPHDQRRFVHEDGRWFHQVNFGAEWLDVSEFTLEEMPLIDRELANWFTSTHPQSHFKDKLIVARAGENGTRLSLLNHDLTTRTRDGRSVVHRLVSPDELLAALLQEFGLRLPPEIRFPLPGA
ncbi:MAG: arylamine N-acetyltransferase [Opitutaceae bacterium]|jgi:N-hydroxyarylamine O-acetyltransferase